MPLVTFKGWEGKWWRNIKPGRAVLDAAVTVLPGSGALSTIGKRIAPNLVRKGVRRFFRGFGKGKKVGGVGAHPGIRTARGGSAITSGKLDLGGGKSFSPGAAFNMRTAAKVGAAGAAGVAAVGVSHGVSIGKSVRPSAAVSVSHGTATSPISRSSPAPRSSSASSSKRCGCPPGQRMLCFKRRHNPEAEAKRRARRKAAREKSKGKTAKRHAKERAAIERRKSTRRARGVRRVLRGVTAKQRAARARFAKAARRGPIRKGTRL